MTEKALSHDTAAVMGGREPGTSERSVRAHKFGPPTHTHTLFLLYRIWVWDTTRPEASSPILDSPPTGEIWPAQSGWKRARV